MKKEIYSVKCPKRLRFGDPSYFEEFRGKKLAELVVDCKPPSHFAAEVILREESMEEDPDYTFCTMTICMAPKETIDIYANDQKYKDQKLKQTEIGTDRPRYLIDVDGCISIVETTGDGFCGTSLEISRGRGKDRILDALIVCVHIPEFEDFESLKQRVNYLFQDVQRLKNPDGPSQQMKM